MPLSTSTLRIFAASATRSSTINRVRERVPIFWSEKQQAWIVGGHAEAVEGFKGDASEQRKANPHGDFISTLYTTEIWSVRKHRPSVGPALLLLRASVVNDRPAAR
jgi:hypothetical protein